MPPQLQYQAWLEVDPPEGCAGTPPLASCVLPLGDGAALVTLLYRSLVAPGAVKSPPRTRILVMSPAGGNAPWVPAADYPAPVMFHVNATLSPGLPPRSYKEELYGLDLTMPGKVYVCDRIGEHIATLAMDIRMDSLIAPQSLQWIGDRLHWISKAGQPMSARIINGEIQEQRIEASAPPPKAEVHFPHTHVCADGCLYVLEFDPLGRISKYRL